MTAPDGPVLTLAPDDLGAFFTEDIVRALPASHGVLSFDHADGASLQLLATADARSCAASRLLACEESSARADLASVTGSVRFWDASCSLHADLLHARLGPSVLGDRYSETQSSLAFFALRADPSAEHPKFEAVSSEKLDKQSIGGDALVGPFTTRRRAERFAEEIVDLYELCRMHERLVLAPEATPCVYKELGTCPAACDGSESLDAYRARYAEAIALMRETPATTLSQARGRMERAAHAQDFERAEAEKATLERLTKLRSPPDHLAGDLRSSAWLAHSRTDRKHREYAAVLRGGRLLLEHVFDPRTELSAVSDQLAWALGADAGGAIRAGTIGATLKRFDRPRAKDPARLVLLEEGTRQEIASALGAAR